MPTTVHLDVTLSVPGDEPTSLAAWVFSPPATGGAVPMLLCLPGGTYSKAYWHLEVPGHPGYSFAEHLAATGMLVVAIDHVGTGESSPQRRAAELTPDVVARSNAVALSQIVERAERGTLAPDLPAVHPSPVIGVGHSMGAMLAIYQQSMHQSFDAIAALGYGTIGPIIRFSPEIGSDGLAIPSRESIMGPATEGAFDDMGLADRSAPDLRHHFYWDDVPAAVIAADDLTNTTLPGVTGPLSVVPFIASDHAGRVTCPVFIGLGERDSTPDHHAEPAGYRSSPDVTLFVLPRSAHCHNMAGTRHQLWDRLARWIGAMERETAAAR